MPLSLRSLTRNTWKTLSSIKTGVILIILVVIFSAAGTVILQRPMTEPDEPPPFFGTWRRVYLGVIGWLAVLILLFYLFARRFAP